MRVIVAGSRDFTDPLFFEVVSYAVTKSGFDITELVCGMAKGIDTHGYKWAEDKRIPVKEFPANWQLYGKAAGPIRNNEMAIYGDALILIWDGESKGSYNMRTEALRLGLPVYEVVITSRFA